MLGRIAFRKDASSEQLATDLLARLLASDKMRERDRALVKLLKYNRGALVSMEIGMAAELVQLVQDTATGPLVYRVHLLQVFVKMRQLPRVHLDTLFAALEHEDVHVRNNAQTALTILTSEDIIDMYLAQAALWIAARFARRPRSDTGGAPASSAASSEESSRFARLRSVRKRRTIGNSGEWNDDEVTVTEPPTSVMCCDVPSSA